MIAQPIRLAVVGCGAVARLCHLPALTAVPALSVAAVVDSDLQRAGSAADAVTQSGLPRPVVADSIQEILGHVEAALICTSPASHAAIAASLLEAGIHVLVEKPLVTDLEEADLLIDAQLRSGAVAAVAHVRRLFPMAVWVKQLLDDGILGTPRHVRWDEGGVFDWPVMSPGMFQADQSGGGVVIDTGVHVFDLLASWFGPDLDVAGYADDSAGGLETEARIQLRAGRLPIDIEFSRQRPLDNVCEITGTHATLRIGTGSAASYTLRPMDGGPVQEGPVPVLRPAVADWTGLYSEQFRAFVTAVRDGGAPLVSLADGRRAIRITRECYDRRPVTSSLARSPQRASDGRGALQRAWQGSSHSTADLAGRRIAITGATGFVGSRLAELLIAGSTAEILALTRGYRNRTRLSRLDPRRLRMAAAEITDPEQLTANLTGVDTLIHCAYGNSGDGTERWRATVEGTMAALHAAAAAGVKRFVHVSSVSVYESGPHLTESSPPLRNDPDDLGYDQQKLRAEQIVVSSPYGGLETVVVQPAVIYGPFGPLWTANPLTRLAENPDALPSAAGDAAGVCNPVFIDDVARALILAATSPEAADQCIIITGPQPTSWGEFYDAYRRILGVPASSDSVAALPDWERDLYRRRTEVRSERAEKILGYHPQFDLAAGMEVVQDWARWYGLLPANGSKAEQ